MVCLLLWSMAGNARIWKKEGRQLNTSASCRYAEVIFRVYRPQKVMDISIKPSVDHLLSILGLMDISITFCGLYIQSMTTACLKRGRQLIHDFLWSVYPVDDRCMSTTCTGVSLSCLSLIFHIHALPAVDHNSRHVVSLVAVQTPGGYSRNTHQTLNILYELNN